MTPTTQNPTSPSSGTVPTVLRRTSVRLARGDVAYVDQGDSAAPAALFVHGVLVNADLWRNVIWDVAGVRRCIAPDLPAHGATPAPGEDGVAEDLSLNGLAAMLDELCERLGLERVDVVANDTGGAVAQVFAARFPHRIRTLTLTNCDVHDNFPPEQFRPFVALAEAGELGLMSGSRRVTSARTNSATNSLRATSDRSSSTRAGDWSASSSLRRRRSSWPSSRSWPSWTSRCRWPGAPPTCSSSPRGPSACGP
jgi:pimeloyl-ACP methyl ester carboxylesterase